MSGSRSVRGRWKVLAQRAAQAQSSAVLWLLYYILLVPMALVRRAARGGSRAGAAAPAWQPHDTHTSDVRSARRRF